MDIIIADFQGLSSEYLLHWMDKGLLPNFRFLSEQKMLQKIICNRIPYEASGIVSAFSGLTDSQHGILSYYKVRNPNYIPELWKSADIKDKMFWTQPEFQNYQFHIINIFGTHPVYPIHGTMFSYLIKHSLHYTYPRTIQKELTDAGIQYLQDLNGFKVSKKGGAFCKEVFATEQTRIDTVDYLLRKESDERISVINFSAIDRLSHFYMHELLDNSVELEDSSVFQAYKLCDEILGKLLRLAGKRKCELLFFSDIGFGHLEHFVSINRYLEQKGYLRRSGFTNTPDWSKTLAFESVQGTSGIQINWEDIYSSGTVKRDEAENLLDRLICDVKQMPNPYTSAPMFRDVVRSSEFYNGNRNAPDLILLPYDERYLPYGDEYWADIVARHTQSGWHRTESLCGGFGTQIDETFLQAITQLTDILPAIRQLAL